MTFGMTVLPEWAQCEGIEPLLDRLQGAGVTDIATSPYVMEPAEDGTREPPADAGSGKVRLLDRELWGRREIRVRTAPSFAPDLALYTDTPYRPPQPDDLSARQGETVARFIEAARGRGMKVWLQVQSAIPPGYRVQFGGPAERDRPLGPDGDPGGPRVDANASLAARDVVEYGRAMLRDLARAYPAIDGIRLDWPEYPPYHFRALFFDFNEEALAVARAMKIDVERMRRDALAVRAALTGGMTNERAALAEPLDASTLDRALADHPGMLDLLALRRRLSLDLVRAYREALPATMALVPQAFPPPFDLLSGFDVAAAAPLVQGIGVKFYTMHWPMILADYADAMSAGPAGEAEVATALATTFGTGNGPLRYPEPDEPHPATHEAIRAKIAVAQAAAEGLCPLYAFTHSYGPREDVMRRARACWEASGGEMWVNRYGYTSDEKLGDFGQLVGSS